MTTTAAQTDAEYTDVFIALDGSKINGNGSNTLAFQANGNLGSGVYWIDEVEVITHVLLQRQNLLEDTNLLP